MTALDEGERPLTMAGTWVLHFSWGCTNTYVQTPITFNPNGTFTGSNRGRWSLQDGTLKLSFDSGPAEYKGTLAGDTAHGEMSTFAGSSGGWHLVKEESAGLYPDHAPQVTDLHGYSTRIPAGASAHLSDAS